MALLKRVLRALPLLLISPLLVLLSALALAVTDVAGEVAAQRAPRRVSALQAESLRHNADVAQTLVSAAPSLAPASASVVIPNWNGRDLLEKYLPSVIEAMAGHPENEIIVVDNGSSDGSAEFVRAAFPQVKLLALPANLGFGGGSNAGFRAARNHIVVLLNSDMRVAPDFLPPLLEGFGDPEVFAVACQIFFSDPQKVREESGLTQAWWQDGALRVRHRIDPAISDLFPCFYPGGGSCAFDREKFLELGGFDELLAPFYLEDTDLGYLAWKRGWKVLLSAAQRGVPRASRHHRQALPRRPDPGGAEEELPAVLLEEHSRVAAAGLAFLLRLGRRRAGGVVRRRAAAAQPGGPLARVPPACRKPCARAGGRANWRASADTEAFRRPLGGYFRDRFRRHGRRARAAARAVRVALSGLPAGTRRRRLHVPDPARTGPAHRDARGGAAGLALAGERQPGAARVLRLGRVAGAALGRPAGGRLDAPARRARVRATTISTGSSIARSTCSASTCCSSNTRPWRSTAASTGASPRALFEHDIYFQSIGRGLGHMPGVLAESQSPRGVPARAALRVASAAALATRCRSARPPTATTCFRSARSSRPSCARACAPASTPSRYQFRAGGREPFTMLFLGSFRHDPNRAALDWFVQEVLPLILARQPGARLVMVGSDPPPAHTYADRSRRRCEMLGFVEDVREPLARYAVFVCPILSGSGVRVKLLEAFAAGIPVVSTRIGAEGLAAKDGEFCALADDPAGFAERVLAAVRRSREGRGNGRPRARRSGGPLGYGGDHRQAGGGVSRPGAPEAGYLLPEFGSRVQILLDAVYNVGGGAIQLLAGVILGGIECRPDHLARFGVHQKDVAFAAPKRGVHGRVVQLVVPGR